MRCRGAAFSAPLARFSPVQREGKSFPAPVSPGNPGWFVSGLGQGLGQNLAGRKQRKGAAVQKWYLENFSFHF